LESLKQWKNIAMIVMNMGEEERNESPYWTNLLHSMLVEGKVGNQLTYVPHCSGEVTGRARFVRNKARCTP
jgi:hypothetical protein